ncbi:MAG: 4Fe-4S dicluster domain-containing protein [Thermodesulfobacteriota bacterium]|nr:4Fe-4S dicluster domain-containing protein [Thermodesulfobacteriota bacterium]
MNEVKPNLIPIYIMGKKYRVPESLTIMKALEYAGYKFIRGCGCRGGICGACSTVFRKPGDYKIYTGLACQTVIEPNMYLTQIPFYPANRKSFDYAELKGVPEEIYELYPELFRCVACNACTKVCPMDVQVMDVIATLKQGDVEKAAQMSFDCIQCGLCASRCFGELPQFHIMQLARRMYGGKIAPRAAHLRTTVKAVKEGQYEELLREVMKMSEEGIRWAYTERDLEPEMAEEMWKPQDTKYLLDFDFED